MRAIDADRLKEKAFSMEVSYPNDEYSFRVVYESDIDEAPTLETRPTAVFIAHNPATIPEGAVALRCQCTCSRCGDWVNEIMNFCYHCGAVLKPVLEKEKRKHAQGTD